MLRARIAPYYLKAGDGRPPNELEMILRIYFLLQWFNLSDPAANEALYDSRTMQIFDDIDLSEAPVLVETTICCFSHLLKRHYLRHLYKNAHRHFVICILANLYLVLKQLLRVAPTRKLSSAKRRIDERIPAMPDVYFG